MLRDRLKDHLQALSEPRNPYRHPQAHERARDYLRAQLESMGRKIIGQPFEVGQLSGCNISAGPVDGGPPQHLVVAHYDTVDFSPGADDNGSAVAVALELARRHSEIAVLFPDLEERDLLGSRTWVKQQLWREATTLVLESVGYWSTEPGSQGYPPLLPQGFPTHYSFLQQRDCRGDFWALLYLDDAREQAARLRDALSHETLAFELNSHLVAHFKDFGRSDHLAFWEVGRPCLMLTDSANFRNPHYHQPTDTSDRLDWEVMARLTEDLSAYLSGAGA